MQLLTSHNSFMYLHIMCIYVHILQCNAYYIMTRAYHAIQCIEEHARYCTYLCIHRTLNIAMHKALIWTYLYNIYIQTACAILFTPPPPPSGFCHLCFSGLYDQQEWTYLLHLHRMMTLSHVIHAIALPRYDFETC